MIHKTFLQIRKIGIGSETYDVHVPSADEGSNEEDGIKQDNSGSPSLERPCYGFYQFGMHLELYTFKTFFLAM